MTTSTPGDGPSPVPTDPSARPARLTGLDRPAIGLKGGRLPLADRLRTALGRIRADRRRLTAAMIVATMASALTYGGLGSLLTSSDPSSGNVSDRWVEPEAEQRAQAVGRAPAEPAGESQDTIILGNDERTLALDRHTVLLPAEVGQRVEVVAMIPTVESVESTVVAPTATVVAVDDSVVVVRLTAEEAGRAVEALAVGSLLLLGTG